MVTPQNPVVKELTDGASVLRHTGRPRHSDLESFMTGTRIVNRVLVVEDSTSLCKTLRRALEPRFEDVHTVGTVAEARAELVSFQPDLMVLDVELPDGTAVDVVKAALARETFPLALAMSGTATPDEAFHLAQLGVRTYLPKPLDLEKFDRALDEVIRAPIEIQPLLRAMVGQRPIQEMEEELRQTMLREALCQARGSRRGAARLLQVSRQLIQHMLRRHEIH